MSFPVCRIVSCALRPVPDKEPPRLCGLLSAVEDLIVFLRRNSLAGALKGRWGLVRVRAGIKGSALGLRVWN